MGRAIMIDVIFYGTAGTPTPQEDWYGAPGVPRVGETVSLTGADGRYQQYLVESVNRWRRETPRTGEAQYVADVYVTAAVPL